MNEVNRRPAFIGISNWQLKFQSPFAIRSSLCAIHFSYLSQLQLAAYSPSCNPQLATDSNSIKNTL